MNYDTWKTDPPDPGSGAKLKSLESVFWAAFATAQRWEADGDRGCAARFLAQQKQVACFAELVTQAEAREAERR